jgi:predicted HAD superfamily Cof-like phosphohydrolase
MAMASVLLACVAGVAGCKQSNEGMGPAQQAGKTLDEVGARAAVKVKEEVAKADAAAAEARAKAPDAVEQAKRNLDKATDKVGQKVEEAGQKLRQDAK